MFYTEILTKKVELWIFHLFHSRKNTTKQLSQSKFQCENNYSTNYLLLSFQFFILYLCLSKQCIRYKSKWEIARKHPYFWCIIQAKLGQNSRSMAALLHAPILLHQRTSRFDHFYDLADTSTRGSSPFLSRFFLSTQVQFTNCTETDTKIGYRMAKSFTLLMPYLVKIFFLKVVQIS